MNNFQEKVNFIWSIAELLRGPYRKEQHGEEIKKQEGKKSIDGDVYVGQPEDGKQNRQAKQFCANSDKDVNNKSLNNQTILSINRKESIMLKGDLYKENKGEINRINNLVTVFTITTIISVLMAVIIVFYGLAEDAFEFILVGVVLFIGTLGSILLVLVFSDMARNLIRIRNNTAVLVKDVTAKDKIEVVAEEQLF